MHNSIHLGENEMTLPKPHYDQKNNREKIMQRWDVWREYIANGGKASWPRDDFEMLIDSLDETGSEPELITGELGKDLLCALINAGILRVKKVLKENEEANDGE